MTSLLSELNIYAQCKKQSLKFWQCPPFLVLAWGIVTIAIIVATYLVAAHYTNDEVVITSVTIVAIFSFIIGGLNIAAFDRLAEANLMKTEFISITSHQLRSPLSILKWTLDLIENEYKKGDGTNSLQSHIPTLRNTTENMIKLVNSILAVSRIEARSLVLKKERFSIVELTSHTIDGFREYAEKSHISFAFSRPDNIPEVTADQEYTEIVIYNLIDNAIRYTANNSVITVTVEYQKNKIRWSVKDQGIGIPKLQQKFIFEKFFRAKTEMQRQTTGSGIGLYIAKAVVETAGGTIGFSSEEGKGSTFWFSLPAPAISKI